jgi:hypothetical protein
MNPIDSTAEWIEADGIAWVRVRGVDNRIAA